MKTTAAIVQIFILFLILIFILALATYGTMMMFGGQILAGILIVLISFLFANTIFMHFLFKR